MYSNIDMFVIDKLPEPLSHSEFTDLIKRVKLGDMAARDKIALHNIKLVINIVLSRFRKTEYEVKELIAVGLIGLVNAIDMYDDSRSTVFSAYAGKCIENEICVFIRKKHDKEVSLDDLAFSQYEDCTLKKSDTIFDDEYDVALDYEKREIIAVIKDLIEKLDGRDREIIKLYFGFYDDRQYSQNEIAIMMGMTRANVSRIMQISLEQLGKKLKVFGILDGEFGIRCWVYNKPNKEGQEVDESILNTIYGYFHSYTRKHVDQVLLMLTDEERKFLSLKYGSNLDQVINVEKLSKSDLDIIYGKIIPKMRGLLELSKINCIKKKKIIKR